MTLTNDTFLKSLGPKKINYIYFNHIDTNQDDHDSQECLASVVFKDIDGYCLLRNLHMLPFCKPWDEMTLYIAIQVSINYALMYLIILSSTL